MPKDRRKALKTVCVLANFVYQLILTRIGHFGTKFVGLRVGLGEAPGASITAYPAAPVLVRHMDHLLLDREELWPALQPDVVLQLGGRLTSKRLAQFLEWAALGEDRWGVSAGPGFRA